MTEEEVQIKLSQHIAEYYPNAVFHNDFGSGVKLGWTRAKRQKEMNIHRGFPDLQICEPIGKWNGFFLELKKDGIRIVKKDGTLVADEHVREQAEFIAKLRDRGYYADFAIGLNEAIRKVEDYMEGRAKDGEWTNWHP